MIIEALVSGVVGGCLCALLGYFISRLGLSTISFATAHAALAGAALALLYHIDSTYTSMTLSLTVAATLTLFYDKLGKSLDSLCMTLFSLFNALTLMALYYLNTKVLATTSVSIVLWGSLLAITTTKLIILIYLFTTTILFLFIFKEKIDTILFDARLAEAEGLNVRYYMLIILALISLTVSIMLRIVGGFLVFTLLYIPTVVVSMLGLGNKSSLVIAPLFGMSSTLLGLLVSLFYDLPVGVSISLSTVLTAFSIVLVYKLCESIRDREQYFLQKVKRY